MIVLLDSSARAALLQAGRYQNQGKHQSGEPELDGVFGHIG
jgi:hypothetical protein